MVCLDSCCEFFIAPEATSTEASPYFNFEVSANGTMLVWFCEPAKKEDDGPLGVPLPISDWPSIRMAASLVDTPGTPIVPEITEPTTWQIEYHLPWSLFAKYFGKGRPQEGEGWSANFYKCADQTSHPHWGAWSSTYDHPSGRPAFHFPAWFGAIDFAPRPALANVEYLAHTIVLCDDMEAMDAFYSKVFGRVPGVAEYSYELESGKTMLRLRERTRGYDGAKGANAAPGTTHDWCSVACCPAVWCCLPRVPAMRADRGAADLPRPEPDDRRAVLPTAVGTFQGQPFCAVRS